jgi:hypothetical protein
MAATRLPGIIAARLPGMTVVQLSGMTTVILSGITAVRLPGITAIQLPSMAAVGSNSVRRAYFLAGTDVFFTLLSRTFVTCPAHASGIPIAHEKNNHHIKEIP